MEAPNKNLPDNAFRELKPGEVYRPIVEDNSSTPEVSLRSVLIGMAMAALFSAAAAFIALKTGQGFETAIPIVLVAVGISAALPRKSTILENVNLMAIGATASGAIGGTIFTMPALWILGLEERTGFLQIFLVALAGTWLGIMLLIPFRRYFVSEMHGKLPFPEGTAIVETLVAGEKGGRQARHLVLWGCVGFLFDGLLYIFKAWREVVSTSIVPFFDPLTRNVKWICSMTASAAMAGLGYIIGLRYATIILAGSLLSWWVLVPLFHWLGQYIAVPFNSSGAITAGGALLGSLDAEAIFREYVQHIGIGGIFIAGLISVLKLLPVIVQALTTGLKGLFSSLARQENGARRSDSDLEMPKVLLLFLAVAAVLFFYFQFGVLDDQIRAGRISLISIAIVFLLSFLFSAVSAWAVAMISVTPVSGMTASGLIFTGLILLNLGLSGPVGMLTAILSGGIFCTSLTMSGTMATALKTAYWTGATPKKLQIWSLLGAVVSAATTGLVILLLAQTHGYTVSPQHPNPLLAPQANAMAAVVKGLLNTHDVPWFLYGLGALISVTVELLGISSLAFALGMYLPLQLNTPIFLGALVPWLIVKTSRQGTQAEARIGRGNIIASGLIAGGGLAGIASAFCIIAGWNTRLATLISHQGPVGNALGFSIFLVLLGVIYLACLREQGRS